MSRRVRSALLTLPPGVGLRLARGLHVDVDEESNGAPLSPEQVRAVSEHPEYLPPATDPAEAARAAQKEQPVTDSPDPDGIKRRLRVRAAGDVWSDEFRLELRRDGRFEASLVLRELLILFVIVILVAVRIVFG